MEDKDTGDGKSVRERVLGMISYSDVNLPAAGTLRILPYVSAGAIDAYAGRVADPRAAFQAMVAASTEGPLEGVPDLSDEDADVIARLYAEQEGFLAGYTAARQAKGPFEAFAEAFQASEMWREYRRCNEQIEAELRRHARLVPKLAGFSTAGIDRTLLEASRAIASFPKIDLPVHNFAAVAAGIDARAITLHASSVAAVSQLADVGRFAAAASANLEQWAGIGREFQWAARIGEAFRERTAFLDTLASRAGAAEQLLKTHADVFASFERVAEVARLPSAPLSDTFDLVTRAFARSDGLVWAANDHFATPMPRARPLERPPAVDPREERAFDAEVGVERTAMEADALVHTTVRQAIVAGNDTLLIVKELVGQAVAEQVGPFAPLLERLRRLAEPKSFLDTLRAFARDFQRDHWKALWLEQGKVYKSRPEDIAQAMLALYLQGHCGGAAFVGRELGNGDGFVDVLVNFLGQDFVVEVKIVGGGSWSIGSVKGGLDQLDAYVRHYETASAYLLVFDGRRSDRGEQLQTEYRLASGATAHVVTVRCYFEAPSK